MGRRIYFIIHFAAGFLLLWLLYQYAHGSLLPKNRAPLWLEASIETAYLVAGVAWGNIGWDAFKRMPSNAESSLVIYVASRTLAPVAIFLPFIAVALDCFYQGTYSSWRSAITWENAVLVLLAVIVLVIQRAYARSEKGFFYRAWQA